MATDYPPVSPEHAVVSFPRRDIMLVTLNRPEVMNSLPVAAHWELEALWHWYDDCEDLRCALVTGAGKKAFSAGIDLKELAKLKKGDQPPSGALLPPGGVAGMSCRDSKKPIIGLVNGHAHGGGFEIALNCDFMLASPNATFRIPDCQHGMAALGGAYPRLCRVIGLHRTMDLSLTARQLSAAEAKDWGIVMRIIPEHDLLREGLKMACAIASLSPQAVYITREAVRDAQNNGVNRSIHDMRQKHLDSLLEGKALGDGLSRQKWANSTKALARL